MTDPTFSPTLCRAARALLGWSQWDLAELAGVGRSTVADFERASRTPTPENRATLRAALERAGVIFIERDGEAGPGVRLRE